MTYCVSLRSLLVAALAATAVPTMAAAQTTVPFTGTVVNACVLTVSVPGVLSMSSDGTTLGSEQSGGVAATLSVVATGSAPTIKFTAPTMDQRPGSYSGTPSVAMKFNSSSGASQSYTSNSWQNTGTALLDTYTINARAQDSSGFTSGNYRVASTATCEQQ